MVWPTVSKDDAAPALPTERKRDVWQIEGSATIQLNLPADLDIVIGALSSHIRRALGHSGQGMIGELHESIWTNAEAQPALRKWLSRLVMQHGMSVKLDAANQLDMR